jgi:hypothetical protein
MIALAQTTPIAEKNPTAPRARRELEEVLPTRRGGPLGRGPELAHREGGTFWICQHGAPEGRGVDG